MVQQDEIEARRAEIEAQRLQDVAVLAEAAGLISEEVGGMNEAERQLAEKASHFGLSRAEWDVVRHDPQGTQAINSASETGDYLYMVASSLVSYASGQRRKLGTAAGNDFTIVSSHGSVLGVGEAYYFSLQRGYERPREAEFLRQGSGAMQGSKDATAFRLAFGMESAAPADLAARIANGRGLTSTASPMVSIGFSILSPRATTLAGGSK
ncbi:MAG: hypothetical protein ACREGI_05375 [Candidatus Levyibacteriota bacterium]